MEVKYHIGDRTFELQLKGEVITGTDSILVQEDHNLFGGTLWNDNGYTIQPFLSEEQYEKVKKGMISKIIELIKRLGGTVDDNFTLEQYHCYVTDEQHLQIVRLIQHGWNVSEFPIDFSIVEERISKILGKPVTANTGYTNTEDFDTGLSKVRYETVYIFSLRIVRPGKMQDNNPPHRDVWIDRLRNAVNVYAPLCGSTDKSSLPLIPGSHFFKESEIERTAQGALLNGIKYSVPCVTTIKGEAPRLLRPQTLENEVMLFSPYLVHGGAYNFEMDRTRMSLEIRFWGE